MQRQSFGNFQKVSLILVLIVVPLMFPGTSYAIPAFAAAQGIELSGGLHTGGYNYSIAFINQAQERQASFQSSITRCGFVAVQRTPGDVGLHRR